ncbi:MAG TPA: hypothetical protein VHM70_06980 [Polyangiaceae bacterium]|jgi:hypothetical protein|nr:hypothetical protein [Polyangiaceae bacterium]
MNLLHSTLALESAVAVDESHKTPSAAEQDAWARELAGMLHVMGRSETLGNQENLGDDGGQASPGTAECTPGSEPQNSDAPSDNRLTLTVSTEALGEVSIIIDRAEGGIRVVLGVQAQVAEEALAPEKMALMRALLAVGLTVHSVNIVRQAGLGTVPAQPSAARISSEEAKSKAAQFMDAARAHKRSKRINLVG